MGYKPLYRHIFMFDFIEKLKHYSNVELLKIVKRPNEYQIDAVNAATQLLGERQVSSEEIEMANHYFDEIEKVEKQKREKIEGFKNKTKDFFEPVLQPTDKVEPRKWLNLFLLVIGLQYAWTLFDMGRPVVWFFQCEDCEFDFSILLSILTILYIPVIFFLLLKAKRWGWILLFADTLFSLILRLSESYVFFKYQEVHRGDTISFVLPIFIKIAFIYFLWSDSISDFFKVNKRIKVKTLIITIAVVMLFLLVMYLLYG